MVTGRMSNEVIARAKTTKTVDPGGHDGRLGEHCKKKNPQYNWNMLINYSCICFATYTTCFFLVLCLLYNL
jgi:hypothetical protein